MTNEQAKQKFLKLYCKNRAFCELYPEHCKEDKCEIYHALQALDAEPIKHGRWVWDKENDKMYCSECGYETDNWGVHQESDPIEWQLPNYCENCGAKMDSNEVENERNKS